MFTAPPASDVQETRARADADLEQLIGRDQLYGIRHSLQIAVPVNVLLSVATLAVTMHHGRGGAGLCWFAVVSAVNGLRLLQSRDCALDGDASRADADRTLRRSAWLAFLSGLVWACTPLLSSGPSQADGVFHLIVAAGIAGGSIAMGFAYAPVAIGFVTPIAVANAVALIAAGTTAHFYLAGTVVVYLVALIRSASQGERAFRAAARLKHEATTLAASLRSAHAETIAVAEEMAHRARHDPLTGLLNRAGFLRRGDSDRDGLRACCLMLLDLDGFKSINDTFGHKVGDRVLAEVGRRIRAALPAEADVARLGGDEFAVMLPRDGAHLAPAATAEQLIAAVSAPFASFDAGRLGVSIGIYDGPVTDIEDALVFADEALYAAKEAGRNRHCTFDEALRRRREMRRDSERDLLSALEGGALQVWYQPIFGEGGRRLASVEALLRWHHPKHGWISPMEIVPAAALAGHAERLFGFVADASCDMARRLRAAGRGEVTVALNVSPREMSQLAIDVLVLERLREAGVPPNALEIEITEETALDIHAVEAKLAALSGAGIRIAIDDFGVGYSSLAILRQLHADRIKIDRCFVTDLSHSLDNRMLVQAVVSLGRAMHLDVVAEGVETAEDVITLRALGCQLMQGYHLGRPMPAHDILVMAAGGEAVSAA